MRLLSLNKFLMLIFLSIGFWICAQNIPAKPAILYPVYDKVGLLSESEKNLLNQKLIKFADSTSTEIEVIIIPNTGGEDVNYLATQYGEKWKIGKKKIDNGIVFLIATEDRKLAIQQGRAVEQFLTASVTGQILDYLVTPYFKQGQWYEGINHGTSAIMDAVRGKFKPIQPKDNSGVNIFKILLIAFIILFILSFLFGDRNGGNYNDDDDGVILSRRGRSTYYGGFFPFPGSFGGGGGSSSGGGFGGFGGGGSFGGGGASGGW